MMYLDLHNPHGQDDGPSSQHTLNISDLLEIKGNAWWDGQIDDKNANHRFLYDVSVRATFQTTWGMFGRINTDAEGAATIY